MGLRRSGPILLAAQSLGRIGRNIRQPVLAPNVSRRHDRRLGDELDVGWCFNEREKFLEHPAQRGDQHSSQRNLQHASEFSFMGYWSKGMLNKI